MRTRTRNTINLIIITMLVMLPLRSVISVEQSTCDMHEQVSQQAHDHAMHAMHQHHDTAQRDIAESPECCCCDSAITCKTDCGIGNSVIGFVISAIQLPSSSGADFLADVSNDLILRELSPPIRPPAIL